MRGRTSGNYSVILVTLLIWSNSNRSVLSTPWTCREMARNASRPAAPTAARPAPRPAARTPSPPQAGPAQPPPANNPGRGGNTENRGEAGRTWQDLAGPGTTWHDQPPFPHYRLRQVRTTPGAFGFELATTDPPEPAKQPGGVNRRV